MSKLSLNMTGKVALISGASSGLGAAQARAIVAQGGKVILGDVVDGPGRQLAGELGENAAYAHLDVTREGDWARAVETAQSVYGCLNVLINNAGVVSAGALGEYSAAEWRRVVEVNLTGAFLGISSCVAMLKAAAPASIVNISSLGGIQGAVGFHAYCASKFGLRGLTKSAALELAPFGVRVNSVHPGPIATPMTEGVPETALNSALRRFGRPEEVAALVVYLASDISSLSTGAEFIADGGESAGYVHAMADIIARRE